ncbi:MAG: hypothetical protein D6746_05145 [Bacteroidetes bacterium]|nr:MAG: hypothetical protein D6746_05145 [Bacteroidota bacterium]
MSEAIVWDAYVRRISRAIAKSEGPVRTHTSPYVSLREKLAILAKYGVSVFVDEEHVTTLWPPDGGAPMHYATVIATITYNPQSTINGSLDGVIQAMLPDEPFSFNVTATASSRESGMGEVTSMYPIESACTRALNRAINTTFHEAFALGDGYGMGDVEQVFNTVESLIEELDNATDKKTFAKVVNKLKAHQNEMTRSQKRLVKLLVDKKKTVLK